MYTFTAGKAFSPLPPHHNLVVEEEDDDFGHSRGHNRHGRNNGHLLSGLTLLNIPSIHDDGLDGGAGAADPTDTALLVSSKRRTS